MQQERWSDWERGRGGEGEILVNNQRDCIYAVQPLWFISNLELPIICRNEIQYIFFDSFENVAYVGPLELVAGDVLVELNVSF